MPEAFAFPGSGWRIEQYCKSCLRSLLLDLKEFHKVDLQNTCIMIQDILKRNLQTLEELNGTNEGLYLKRLAPELVEFLGKYVVFNDQAPASTNRQFAYERLHKHREQLSRRLMRSVKGVEDREAKTREFEILLGQDAKRVDQLHFAFENLVKAEEARGSNRFPALAGWLREYRQRLSYPLN